MKTITPFLWFNDNAEDAINFYLDIFKRSKIFNIRRLPDGRLFTAEFEIENQRLMVINGGPHDSMRFTEAISLFIACEGQDEVDELWGKLTADGGTEGQCGWCKDKFGLSWQVIPKVLGDYLNNEDPEKAAYAMDQVLKMKKIVIADLTK